MPNSLVHRVVWVLWPAFLVAAVAQLVFFALIDPAELSIFGVPVDAGRMPIYTIGFFFFWAVAASASALTVLLQPPPVSSEPLAASGASPTGGVSQEKRA